MLSQARIRNFRGLSDVRLDELRSVNLIVGGNNTGKTSVLEALVLLLGNQEQISRLPSTFRVNPPRKPGAAESDSAYHFWPWLFKDRDPGSLLKIEASRSGTSNESTAFTQDIVVQASGGTLNRQIIHDNHPWGANPIVAILGGSVEIRAVSNPLGLRLSSLSTHPTDPTEDAERFNQVALTLEGENRMQAIMASIDPRVRRLRYGKPSGTHSPLVFVDLGLTQAVPSTQMGQAFNRLLHIYAQILAAGTTVLLVDEIENGIFSESMPLIWKGLLEICEREGVQIFATTHSRECVMAAQSAANARGNDELCVQRLQLSNGHLECVRLGTEHLQLAAEAGLEVRS